MSNKKVYSREFKLEAASLVVEQNYTIREAYTAMGVSASAMRKWVAQLRNEREGHTPRSAPLTEEQLKIKALEKQLSRLKEENTILKKASALLMSDSINHLK